MLRKPNQARAENKVAADEPKTKDLKDEIDAGEGGERRGSRTTSQDGGAAEDTA